MIWFANENTPRKYLRTLVKAGANVLKGQLVTIDTGEAVACATGAQTDAAVIGLVVENAVAGAECLIALIDPSDLLRIEYTGASKTSLAAADLGLAYDMAVSSGDQKLDLDDTTGGWIYVWGYDNDAKTALVKVGAVDLLH